MARGRLGSGHPWPVAAWDPAIHGPWPFGIRPSMAGGRTRARLSFAHGPGLLDLFAASNDIKCEGLSPVYAF